MNEGKRRQAKRSSAAPGAREKRERERPKSSVKLLWAGTGGRLGVDVDGPTGALDRRLRLGRRLRVRRGERRAMLGRAAPC